MANTTDPDTILRDGNRVAHLTLDSYNVTKCAPSAFAGGTTNARGDDGGSNDPFTLFNVTGDVAVRLFGVCTSSLTGANATIEVGITGNTALLLAQETATEIDVGNPYVSATQVVGGVALSSVTGPFLIVNGNDIIETVGTADITGGNMYYICLWRPISRDGKVVATYPE